jgi:hypothetical protein
MPLECTIKTNQDHFETSKILDEISAFDESFLGEYGFLKYPDAVKQGTLQQFG